MELANDVIEEIVRADTRRKLSYFIAFHDVTPSLLRLTSLLPASTHRDGARATKTPKREAPPPYEGRYSSTVSTNVSVLVGTNH